LGVNHVLLKATEGKKQPKIVLTKPFSLEVESDSEPSYGYRAPNLIRRLLSLLKNVRPGADLTNLQASTPSLTSTL